MFVAEMEAVSGGEAAGKVQGGAAPAVEPMSRTALAQEADAVADHMQARGAEQHVRIWRHLAETARRTSAAQPVSALASPSRDEIGSFVGYR